MNIFFTIFKVFVVLTMIFIVWKSIYVTKQCKKDSNPISITVYSGFSLINVGLLVILFIPLTYISSKEGRLFTFDNIYLLFFLLFIAYQIYSTTRLSIYKDGFIIFGQYYKFNVIEKARIDDVKFGTNVMLATKVDGMSFRVAKKNEEIIRNMIKNHRIKMVNFNK